MYLCALSRGMRPEDTVIDEQRRYKAGWAPRNFDRKYRGPVTLEYAFIRSLNTVPVALFYEFGADCFADMLSRYGIRLDDPDEPTAVLGSEYVSLLSLAAAYATLANGGYRVEPYAVRYARRTRGEILYRHVSPTSAPVLTEERPYCDLLRMLRNVTSAKGTGHAAAFDHPVWGKTGTSEGYRDALFAGFTGRHVAVVWLGRQADGPVSHGITGGELPAETFQWLMATLEDGEAPVELDCRGPALVASRAIALN
jgi:penicillin-binding protein 1A